MRKFSEGQMILIEEILEKGGLHVKQRHHLDQANQSAFQSLYDGDWIDFDEDHQTFFLSEAGKERLEYHRSREKMS